MKNKKIIIPIIIILIIAIFLSLLLFKKPSILGDIFYNISTSNKNTTSAVIDLDNPGIEELSTEYLKTEGQNFGINRNRENVMTSPGTPFYSDEGWVANIQEINPGSISMEIYNNSDHDITITEDFAMYLGVTADDDMIISKTTEGLNKILKPGETTKVKVVDGQDAKYFKVGYGNYPLDWAMYPVSNPTNRVIIEEQIMDDTNANSENYVLMADIVPYKFKYLNIGTNHSRKINKNEYNGVSISKEERKKYPYSTLGYIKVDIFNNGNKDLEITSLDLLYNQKGKVINTETINYTENIKLQEVKFIEIPFKFLGSNISTTIVLKTNFGNITIYKPELLFGTIQR